MPIESFLLSESDVEVCQEEVSQIDPYDEMLRMCQEEDDKQEGGDKVCQQEGGDQAFDLVDQLAVDGLGGAGGDGKQEGGVGGHGV